MTRSGTAVPAMLSALDMMLDKPRQVYIIGGSNSDAALRQALRTTYLPNRSIVITPEQSVQALQSMVPSLSGKVARKGKATAYVCQGGICQRPTSDPKVLASQLAQIHPLSPTQQ